MEDKRYSGDLNSGKNYSTRSQPVPTTKEESSKLWLIPLIVIVFLIATGIFMYFSLKPEEKTQEITLPDTQQNTSKLSSSVTNCGVNMNCLIDASKKCELAKLTSNTTLELFGMLITTTTSYEIRGTQENKCILYLRTENQSIEFSDAFIQQAIASGATQEQIDQQKQEANKQSELVRGLDGTCKFRSNSDLTSLLGKWKSGTFSGSVSCKTPSSESNCTSTGDWAVAECIGEVFWWEWLSKNGLKTII